MLMHGILDEANFVPGKLEIHLSKNQLTLADEAVALKPDLIIMDVDMFFKPSADEVVSQLRQKEELKETVILLNRSMLGHLAGLAGSQQRADKTIDECLASGASHYVGLINTESFLLVVDEYCR